MEQTWLCVRFYQIDSLSGVWRCVNLAQSKGCAQCAELARRDSSFFKRLNKGGLLNSESSQSNITSSAYKYTDWQIDWFISTLFCFPKMVICRVIVCKVSCHLPSLGCITQRFGISYYSYIICTISHADNKARHHNLHLLMLWDCIIMCSMN